MGQESVELIPYKVNTGCVIKTTSNSFFPAKLTNSMKGSHVLTDDQSAEIKHFVTGCMLSDESLLVVEESYFHRCLKEYSIGSHKTRRINKSGRKLCDLEASKKIPISFNQVIYQIAVTSLGTKSRIVVCDSNGFVETVGFGSP